MMNRKCSKRRVIWGMEKNKVAWFRCCDSCSISCVSGSPVPSSERGAGSQVQTALGEALNSLLLIDGETDKNKDAHLLQSAVRGLIG